MHVGHGQQRIEVCKYYFLKIDEVFFYVCLKLYIYIYIPWLLGYAGLIFVCTSCGLCYIKSEKAL